MTTDLRNDVTEIVLAGLREAQAQGNLPEAEVDDAVVERPNNPEHGYLSSTLPLKRDLGSSTSRWARRGFKIRSPR